MSNTPNIAMPLVASGQNSGEVTHNDALNLIDAILQGSVKDRDLATPPGSPANGDVYLVASSPTGAWSGQAGKIAYYATGWKFLTPREGWQLWVMDEDVWIRHDGSAWKQVPPLGVLSINSANSSAISNTTSPTDFSVTYTIPAERMNAVGKTFRISAAGYINLVSSATVTYDIRINGSSNLLTVSGMNYGTTAVNQGWQLNAIVSTRATGASGSLHTMQDGVCSVDSRAGKYTQPTDTTVDLTASVQISIRVTWSAASASNSIVLTDLIVEELA